MRFARGDVRDHIVSRKTTTDLHIRAKEVCSRRDSSESIFARFSASSDFRLLQQYLPAADFVHTPNTAGAGGCTPRDVLFCISRHSGLPRIMLK
jgi:hypothetical protein